MVAGAIVTRNRGAFSLRSAFSVVTRASPQRAGRAWLASGSRGWRRPTGVPSEAVGGRGAIGVRMAGRAERRGQPASTGSPSGSRPVDCRRFGAPTCLLFPSATSPISVVGLASSRPAVRSTPPPPRPPAGRRPTVTRRRLEPRPPGPARFARRALGHFRRYGPEPDTARHRRPNNLFAGLACCPSSRSARDAPIRTPRSRLLLCASAPSRDPLRGSWRSRAFLPGVPSVGAPASRDHGAQHGEILSWNRSIVAAVAALIRRFAPPSPRGRRGVADTAADT